MKINSKDFRVQESVRLASEGFRRLWKVKQGNKSLSYTTRRTELPVTVA
jgi:Domain of unknown function (DUF4113)